MAVPRFQPAVKEAEKVRIGLSGPGGSGKSYTALTLATHLSPNRRVAVIDTEFRSARKYADLFQFDTIELDRYDPNDLIALVGEAVAGGYEALVIDSMSAFWKDAGGFLEMVDKVAARMRAPNTFAAWNEVDALYNKVIRALLGADLHLIACFRAKVENVQEKNERGQTVVRKLGYQPIFRDTVEYEFDVFGDLDSSNTLCIRKTRCPALHQAVIARPGPELAATLLAWASSGESRRADAPSSAASSTAAPSSTPSSATPTRAPETSPTPSSTPAPSSEASSEPEPDDELALRRAEAAAIRRNAAADPSVARRHPNPAPREEILRGGACYALGCAAEVKPNDEFILDGRKFSGAAVLRRCADEAGQVLCPSDLKAFMAGELTLPD